MIKTNYQAIAKIIKHVLGNSIYFHPFVDTIVSYMKDENSAFNETKFREACRADLEDGKELKDKDGEARKDLTVEQRIVKYQDDKYGVEEATLRMNQRNKEISEQIRKEKQK